MSSCDSQDDRYGKTMKAQRKGPGGWAQDMKLKKLKAARAKWLENQQARERPNDLQLIANSDREQPVR